MPHRSIFLAHDSAGVADIAEVALLHAFPLDRRLWARILEHPPAGARVTALDLPGFGSSPIEALGPTGEFDFDEIAEAVARTLAELGIERVIVGGCSMGGFATFAMLRRHPEMVSGVLLSDTRAIADTPEARAGRTAMIEMVERDGMSAVAELMSTRLLGPTTINTRPEVVSEVREIILEQSAETIVTALRGMAARPDSTPLLAEISVPAIVVVGDQDPTVSVDEARAMSDAISGCELAVIEGAGHLPSLEDPVAFGAALQSLVARLDT